MNAKILTVVVGLLMLVPAGYAASYKFGSCPSGYSCDQDPDGAPFPPDAVTGHTVYAKFLLNRANESRATLGLPTDFAAVAGYFDIIDERNIAVAVQRECVVWFDGHNLDQRPDPDNFNWGSANSFPSDEDELGNGDNSSQDYDFDRDVDTCVPRFENGTEDAIAAYSTWAVVVEKGDCNPSGGRNFRFRGHLDFVDPNNIYHEVQEYDYVCSGPRYAGVNVPSPTVFGINPQVGPRVSDAVKQLFPWTYTDPHNYDGCSDYVLPTDGVGASVDPNATGPGVNQSDPVNSTPPSADPEVTPQADPAGYFDLGHKCNGSVQDLFVERLWITLFHETVFDPTIQDNYNFAIQIDTCSGLNIYELNGKEADGQNNSYAGSTSDPGSSTITGIEQIGVGRNIDSVDWYLDTLYGEATGTDRGLQPLVEVCHDGSSFSFDDTPRGRTVHSGPPATEQEIMRGNSYGYNQSFEETFGKHRQNCRSNWISWPYNEYPGPHQAPRGPLGLLGASPRQPVGDDCYPEDHKTAQIDIYVYDFDPTGQWYIYTNGLTGPNAYTTGPGTGPDDIVYGY